MSSGAAVARARGGGGGGDRALTYRDYATTHHLPEVLNTSHIFVVDHITKMSPWFFCAPLSDEEVKDVLRGAPDGVFIVRVSRTFPDSFVLVYWCV